MLGKWNVRTMFEAGRTQQIANEMSRYKINLLGISETRWIKSGRFPLANTWSRLYALSRNNQSIDGVGTY